MHQEVELAAERLNKVSGKNSQRGGAALDALAVPAVILGGVALVIGPTVALSSCRANAIEARSAENAQLQGFDVEFYDAFIGAFKDLPVESEDTVFGQVNAREVEIAAYKKVFLSADTTPKMGALIKELCAPENTDVRIQVIEALLKYSKANIEALENMDTGDHREFSKAAVELAAAVKELVPELRAFDKQGGRDPKTFPELAAGVKVLKVQEALIKIDKALFAE